MESLRESFNLAENWPKDLESFLEGVDTWSYELCVDTLQGDVRHDRSPVPFTGCPHPGGVQVSDSGQTPTYDPSTVPSSRQSPMTALPSSTAYAGPYQFQLEFGKQPKETKSAAWTYSSILNKLYAQKDAMCPVRFRAEGPVGPGGGLFVRALPIFTRHEYVQEIVKRCPNHIQAPESANVPHKEHFVWCENQAAQYTNGGCLPSQSGRYSVLVPFEQPPAGTPWVTYLYSFKCLNSCVGGPNRREMTMIFTLESSSGEVLGRQCFDLRICACPGRDRKTDEGKHDSPVAAPPGNVVPHQQMVLNPVPYPQQQEHHHQQANAQAVAPAGLMLAAAPKKGRSFDGAESQTVTKRARIPDDDEVYSITVKGKSNYDTLRLLRDSLELTDRMRPFDRQQYLQSRQYADGPVIPAITSSACEASSPGQGRTSFGFSLSSEVVVKPDLVDSTQPCGGVDTTDSGGGTGAQSLDVWLESLGLLAYRECFYAHGVTTTKQLAGDHIKLQDLVNMGIPPNDRNTIWKHLLLYRRTQHSRVTSLIKTSAPNSSTVTTQTSSAKVTLSASSSCHTSQPAASESCRQPVVFTLTRCSFKANIYSGNEATLKQEVGVNQSDCQ